MASAIARTQARLQRVIMQHFPSVDFAMAYGSGAFPQANYKGKSPMIDFIVGVNDPAVWHQENMQRNQEHYAFPMVTLGARAVGAVQEWGQRVYYHPFVSVYDKVDDLNLSIKYGVMSREAIYDDLLNWSTLFLSGRLHKPTSIIIDDTKYNGISFSELQGKNIQHALHAAILLLPENFSEEELYGKIASLSYMGDWRFKVGAEAPSKVMNIVHGSAASFRTLYKDAIVASPWIDYKGQRAQGAMDLGSTMQRAVSKESITSIMEGMPSNFLRLANRHVVMKDVSDDPEKAAQLTAETITAILNTGQLVQYGKGTLSAGFGRSFVYLMDKLKKGRGR